jgi:hypothetical protein
MSSDLAKNILSNSMLLKSDWDSIDNKYLINNVRKSTAYTIFTDIVTKKQYDGLRPHQQELFDHINNHLNGPIPLRIVYSTPTGSGKTFSSMLLQKLLLKSRRPMPLLIYSVPTKEILKRVGSDCEAHGINYWTAGKIGTDYFIRRPYSIRNSKENAGQLRGDMYYQLLLTIAQSKRFEDKIPGRCEVILADIEATAKLLEVLSQPDDVLNAIKLTSFGNPNEELKPCHKLILDGINNPETRHKYTSWLNPENTILFFDEPNMGIHISPDVLAIVKRITSNYPHISILASATMKNWESLPEWWHGSPGRRAKYHTISSMAFSLPVAELGLITDNYKKSHAISAFDLFNNHADFISYMSQINDISMGQLLRHFTEKQVTSSNITSSADAKKAFNTPDTLQDFRQTVLKQYLNTIDEHGFNTTRDTWSNYKGTEISSLNDNISTTGITLIATHHPHKIAYLLTKMKDDAEWNDEIHNVRRITKHAQNIQKEREREFAKAEKLKKKRQKDEDAEDGEPEHTPVKCKFGRLELYVDELNELSEQSLVFLSKGIAISSPDADPGIKLQFQRAIYSRPETLTVLPDIHILVVDYASIYGLDCPGVDKIILCDDLGDLLNQDDIIQFIGRLRRKGDAVFMNFKNMVKILEIGRAHV